MNCREKTALHLTPPGEINRQLNYALYKSISFLFPPLLGVDVIIEKVSSPSRFKCSWVLEEIQLSLKWLAVDFLRKILGKIAGNLIISDPDQLVS